jgi:hypothetical protein
MTRLARMRRRIALIRDVAGFYYARHVKSFDPPSKPLLDGPTAEWLERQLKGTRLFLEFGSGGSTVLADRHGIRTISVESDPYYAAAVLKALQHPEKTQILTPRMGLTWQWGMPVFFKAKKGRRYVTAAFKKLDGEFPDLIFVDGRYRVACALQSASEAAHVGATSRLLIDDYFTRPAYHVLERYLPTPERIGRAAVFMLGRCEIPEDVISSYSADAC